ncbi:MAG: hypothetical protein GY929_26105 [Actinomycetia bacterium]|nr:hypothetical protein [Actinomycetes bacterium]
MSQVERSIEIDSHPEEVWRAFESDERAGDWLGEGGHLDPRPGGEVGTDERVGIVEHADPGRQLGWRWWSTADIDDVTVVTVWLEPVDDRTRVRVVEHRPVGSTGITMSIRPGSLAPMAPAHR